MNYIFRNTYRLLFLLPLLLFSACKQGADKTPKEYLTQNKWMWVKGVVDPSVKNSKGIVTNDYYGSTADSCYYDNIYTFNQDGTGSVDQGKIKCSDDITSKFKWLLREDYVLLKTDEEYILGSKVLTLVKIDDEYMTLTWQYPAGKEESPYFYTDTYKAVK